MEQTATSRRTNPLEGGPNHATGAASAAEGREQELVREFFDGVHRGFFVEVGANRPQQESQTWHLEQLGWTGVLIEPQPNLADDLARKRTAKVFAAACSSPANAGRRMPPRRRCVEVASIVTGWRRAQCPSG
jgi:hypothetical protein